MTDEVLAKAELVELRKHSKLAAAYGKTAAQALEGLAAEMAAVDTRAGNVLAALEDGPPDPDPDPDALPKASLHDAADTLPGQTMAFPLALDKPCAVDIPVHVSVSADMGDVEDQVWATLAAGKTSVDLKILIPADAEPQTLTASLTAGSEDIEIADGEAVGRVVVAPQPQDKLIFMREPEQPITVPIDVPAGEWVGLCAVAMVVKYAPSGKYQKFIGSASSQSAGQGAFCIGMKPDDKLNIWRAGGGQANPLEPAVPMPQNRAVFVVWRANTAKQYIDVDLNSGASGTLLEPLAAVDGPGAIGAGYWAGKRVDPLAPGSEIRAIAAWREWPTDAEIIALRERWKHLVDGGPDPGPVDGLEPVNTSAVRVDAEVGSSPTHTWIGFGWGANASAGAIAAQDKVAQFADRVFDELGVGVLRLWTPENTGTFLNAYRKTYQVAKAHGVHTVIASGFVWRGNTSPEKFADGVAASIAGGIAIDMVDLQNEPDGNPLNRVTSDLVDAYHRIRARLDHHGLQRVKIKGFAWAHSGTGGAIDEFDKLKAAGMAGAGKTVVAGSGHCYSDCGRPAIWRDRWAKVGGYMVYDETGNLGLPHGIARSLSAVLHGGSIECAHIGLISTVNPTGEPAAQALVYGDGRRAPWHAQYATVFKNLPRGTILRPVTCSDRPPGLSAEFAQHMVRSPGKNPRLQMASGKMPDGRWYLAAVNTTKGGGEQSIYVGACFQAATLQVTTRIGELAGKNGTFLAMRCDAGGAVRPAQNIALKDGHTRFTLGPGELAVLVGGAT